MFLPVSIYCLTREPHVNQNSVNRELIGFPCQRPVTGITRLIDRMGYGHAGFNKCARQFYMSIWRSGFHFNTEMLHKPVWQRTKSQKSPLFLPLHHLCSPLVASLRHRWNHGVPEREVRMVKLWLISNSYKQIKPDTSLSLSVSLFLSLFFVGFGLASNKILS